MAVANPITIPSRPKGMFRRDFMKMQPVLLAAIFTPKLAQAGIDADTPVKRAFLEWRGAYIAQKNAEDRFDDDVVESLITRAYRLADQVVEAESKTPGDTIYKIAAYTFYAEHDACDGALGHLILKEACAWVEVAK